MLTANISGGMRMTKKSKSPKQRPEVGLWHMRQIELANLLVACDAIKNEPHVDWEAERVEWFKANGERAVEAKMKPLYRLSLQNERNTIPSPEKGNAWHSAMRLAQQNKAEYLYSIKSQGSVIFVGLWDVQPVVSNTQVALRHNFALELLDRVSMVLQQKYKDTAYLRRFLLNQAQSLSRRSGPFYESKIHETLTEMASKFGERRFVFFSPAPLSQSQLDKLNQEVEELRSGIQTLLGLPPKGGQQSAFA